MNIGLTDIILLDKPSELTPQLVGADGGYILDCEDLRKLIRSCKPRVHLFGLEIYAAKSSYGFYLPSP